MSDVDGDGPNTHVQRQCRTVTILSRNYAYIQFANIGPTNNPHEIRILRHGPVAIGGRLAARRFFYFKLSGDAYHRRRSRDICYPVYKRSSDAFDVPPVTDHDYEGLLITLQPFKTRKIVFYERCPNFQLWPVISATDKICLL